MRIAVTGSEGQVGREVVTLARAQGHEAIGLTHSGADACDITDEGAVRACLAGAEPDVVIHAAALTDVDACELDEDRALAVNAAGTAHVARASKDVGAHLVYLSTDYVFDGRDPKPYVEDDPVSPLSAYGRSKVAGEARAGDGATIVRTSWVCGAHGRNVVRTVLGLAGQGRTLRFVSDQVGQPTFAVDLADQLLRLGAERRPGIWHVTNDGPMSWYGFVRLILEVGGHDPDLVEPIATTELDPPRPAPRPANSVLDNRALREAGLPPMPPVRPSLERLVAELRS